jgi:hypothetical protein
VSVLIHEPKIGLGNERRWLERVVGAIAAELSDSAPAKLAVNDRHKLVTRDIAIAQAWRSAVTSGVALAKFSFSGPIVLPPAAGVKPP